MKYIPKIVEKDGITENMVNYSFPTIEQCMKFLEDSINRRTIMSGVVIEEDGEATHQYRFGFVHPNCQDSSM